MARGPGPMATVHRTLILAALVCAFVYAAFELRVYAEGGGGTAMLRSGLGALAGLLIGIYLRSLRSLPDRLTPRGGDPGTREG